MVPAKQRRMNKSFVNDWQNNVQGFKPLRHAIGKILSRRIESVRRRLRLPVLPVLRQPGLVPEPLLLHLHSKLCQKVPSYSSRGTTPQSRDRTATPPKRVAIDPWVMSPSSRAETFVPTGFTPADFPDVEMAILPKGRAQSRLSSTSATSAREPFATGAFFFHLV